MTDIAPFQAFLTRDRSEIVMMRRHWRHRIPAADARKWLGLYTRLRDRGAPKGGWNGPWAAFYADAVETLAKIVKQLEETA